MSTLSRANFSKVKRLRVLIVEDEGMVAMLLEDMLDDLGCEVACSAASVAQAIGWLDEGGQLDAALLDVNLGNESVWPVADRTMSVIANESGMATATMTVPRAPDRSTVKP